MTRARLASVYAGLLGAEVSAADLLEHIQIAAGGGQLGLEEMAASLRGVGLTAKVEEAPMQAAEIWPALALMKSDQVILVLGQSDTTVEVYDTTCPDNRADVPIADCRFFQSICRQGFARPHHDGRP
jgi:ATP-binding cassette subfamily C protein LapB